MSDQRSTEKIVLARWTDRFIAWMIDFLVVLTGIGLVGLLFAGIDERGMVGWMPGAEAIAYATTSAVFFAYWTILEYFTGRTVGKKILNLRVARMGGEAPTLGGILISSFGKAFLLPLDVMLGWLLTNEYRQRAFCKVGSTIVIKTKSVSESELRYEKD